MNNASRWFAGVTLAVVFLLLTGATPAVAQSGGGKDTQKLQKAVEDSRETLQAAVNQIKGTMTVYNSLMGGDAKKPDKTYKDLSKGADECDKAAEKARKSVDSMHKDLGKFYQTWEKEIEAYQSDSMKEHGKQSLEKVKTTFNNYDAALKEAADLYHPFIATLHDHVTFMGRDLSPDSLAGLKDDAAKLNQDAESLYAKVSAAIEASKPGSADDTAKTGDTAAGDDDADKKDAGDAADGNAAGDAGSDPASGETGNE